jgi:transposase InsO family protein
MTRLQGDGSRASLSIDRMCALAGVSRASWYRHWREVEPDLEELALRDAIQRLALANRHYGYRRIGELLRREGWCVNAKRVLRLTGEDNLLCLRKKAFVPATTDSRHGFRVWPNLTKGLQPMAVDRLWVADITYVRLGIAFVYLAVILDAYSRKVIGWALEDHLEARLPIAALEMAIAARRPTPGELIHHTDRGVQYACGDYADRLEAAGILPSMSRPGCPYDNAKAESFMKTLKTEEVDGSAYRDIAHARASIGEFIEQAYNRQRLHSALDYRSPMEFEAERPWAAAQQPKALAQAHCP